MTPPEPAATARAPITLLDEDRRTLLRIAREELVEYFRGTQHPPRAGAGPALEARRAAFVTLTRRDTGALRGCRGEVIARRPLAESVARMAVASATTDPRFPPVTPDELPLLRISVNALTALFPIRPDEIVVGRHGLVLTVEGRSGLLLPEVPLRYGWDRDRFLVALCRKAGVADDAWRRPDAELSGFEAETCSEDDFG
jgi:AmmeMemoRadiSam system protein A